MKHTAEHGQYDPTSKIPCPHPSCEKGVASWTFCIEEGYRIRVFRRVYRNDRYEWEELTAKVLDDNNQGDEMTSSSL